MSLINEKPMVIDVCPEKIKVPLEIIPQFHWRNSNFYISQQNYPCCWIWRDQGNEVMPYKKTTAQQQKKRKLKMKAAKCNNYKQIVVSSYIWSENIHIKVNYYSKKKTYQSSSTLFCKGVPVISSLFLVLNSCWARDISLV